MQRELSRGLRSKLLKYLARKRRESDKLLREYIERLKQVIPNSVILLFGSRAKGEHLPYSDYDIAVILEKVDNKISTIEELRKLKPRGLNLDLTIILTSELKDKIVQEMLKNSIILYKGMKLEIQYLKRESKKQPVITL